MNWIVRYTPLRGLPNPKEVWAWGMYDFANQSFTLLINTLLFAVYFKEVVVGDPAQGDRLWAMLVASSLLVVVVVSPVIGALGDARGWRKEILLGTGVGCVALTCSLGLVGPEAVLLAALLYFPANVLYQIGENFLASFLLDVSTPRNIGRISATGWTMGYVGSVGLMICVVLAMQLFGIAKTPDWSPLFVFAGIWFAVGMIPAAFILKESPRDMPPGTGAVRESIRRVRDTFRHVSRYGQLARFLISFLIYGFGVQSVIMFAAIIASDFGIQGAHLAIFALQVAVTAGIAAALTGLFQDKIGTRTTVIANLVLWIGTSLMLLGLTLVPSRPEWMFWVVGNFIGLGLGGIGTSSRAMVGRFSPKHRSAEFFGLWGMTYKLAGAIGVLSFGLVKAGVGDTGAMVLLASFFAVGLVGVLTVNEAAGVRAKLRAERDHDAVPPSAPSPTPES